MKFGQLIKYKMRNVPFEKPHTKCGGEISPRPFPKKSNLVYLRINSRLRFDAVCFY